MIHTGLLPQRFELFSCEGKDIAIAQQQLVMADLRVCNIISNAASIRLPKRVACSLVELPLGLAGRDCHLFYKRTHLPKTQTP